MFQQHRRNMQRQDSAYFLGTAALIIIFVPPKHRKEDGAIHQQLSDESDDGIGISIHQSIEGEEQFMTCIAEATAGQIHLIHDPVYPESNSQEQSWQYFEHSSFAAVHFAWQFSRVLGIFIFSFMILKPHGLSEGLHLFKQLTRRPIYSIDRIQQAQMESILKCRTHNLPEEIVCLGQFCAKRIGCELCIARHDHKFFLDNKNKDKNMGNVRQEVKNKLVHLKDYTRVNVKSLKLEAYRDKLTDQFQQERLYLNNKLQEERTNFEIYMEKVQLTVSTAIDRLEKEVLGYWDNYNCQAQRHLDSQQEYNKLIQHFGSGDWTGHSHVDLSVNFLYSQELLFRFNRNLDKLKKQINHHKKENELVLGWLFTRRNEFHKYEFCPHSTFKNLIGLYEKQPFITDFKKQHTKENRDDQESVLSVINSETKALMIYPKIIYEPFQNIDKLIRYNNNIFATSGGRSINLWTRVSMQPEKTYPLDYPAYGLSTFREHGQDDPEILIYGKSNGQLGLINVEKETVKEMDAHQSLIKDILQVDEYHFLTASYDWSIKLWGLNHDPHDKQFATERLTLKGSSGKVQCICKFGPNVLSAGADNVIRIWDVMRASFDQTYSQEKEVNALAEIRPQFFASGGELKELRIWDYRKTKGPMMKFPIEHSIQTILRYDDNTLIFNDKNTVKIIDIRNFQEPLLRLDNSTVYSHSINAITFLSDVEIGMGGSDTFITLWKY